MEASRRVGGGALMGGPQYRMSILRNPHVPCHYFGNFHVDFKNVLFTDLAPRRCYVWPLSPPFCEVTTAP